MNEKELWKYFHYKKAFYSKPFDRDFIWITKENFLPIKKYFMKDLSLSHSGKSYRSHGLLSHTHAIDEGDYFFVHKDIGNLARFLPLGLLHLMLDVIPYFILAKVKGVKTASFFLRPKLGVSSNFEQK